MAASKALETKKLPVFTRSGLLRIENGHMTSQLTQKGKVIKEEFNHLYPNQVSGLTGEQLAERYPQSITVGREATYFIPKGRLATLRGASFALPRSLIANLRQELSSGDLYNRVYHNRTYPGCMIEAWDVAAKNEKKYNEANVRPSTKIAKGRVP
jgi:hypothetical protein